MLNDIKFRHIEEITWIGLLSLSMHRKTHWTSELTFDNTRNIITVNSWTMTRWTMTRELMNYDVFHPRELTASRRSMQHLFLGTEPPVWPIDPGWWLKVVVAVEGGGGWMPQCYHERANKSPAGIERVPPFMFPGASALSRSGVRKGFREKSPTRSPASPIRGRPRVIQR